MESEIRNPREIQWISKSRTPRRAVADPSAVSHRVLASEACSAHPAPKVLSLDARGCFVGLSQRPTRDYKREAIVSDVWLRSSITH